MCRTVDDNLLYAHFSFSSFPRIGDSIRHRLHNDGEFGEESAWMIAADRCVCRRCSLYYLDRLSQIAQLLQPLYCHPHVPPGGLYFFQFLWHVVRPPARRLPRVEGCGQLLSSRAASAELLLLSACSLFSIPKSDAGYKQDFEVKPVTTAWMMHACTVRDQNWSSGYNSTAIIGKHFELSEQKCCQQRSFSIASTQSILTV